MKKLLVAFASLMFIGPVYANGAVVEGVIKSANPISGEVGEDGHPILGAAVGAGIGSLFGSGSGRDAAMVVGGVMGARRQAAKQKQTMYGWQYVIEGKDGQLHSVNSWCGQPNTQCAGIMQGKEVYVINGNQVSLK